MQPFTQTHCWRYLCAPIITVCLAVSAFAAQPAAAQNSEHAQNTPSETRSNAPSQNASQNASEALESILQRAAKGGLIRSSRAPDPLDGSEIQPDEDEAQTPIAIECADADIINLAETLQIMSYDEVFEIKSAVTETEALSDFMPLVRAYLALGMGSEAADLVADFDAPTAELVTAVGRILDGIPDIADVDRVAAYQDCHNYPRLLALMGEFSIDRIATAPVNPTAYKSQLELNEELIPILPYHVGRMFKIRLAIHASEIGLDLMAERILNEIEPNVRRGYVPDILTDERLYLFARVMMNNDDPRGLPIMTHLSETDGVYQTRAIETLIAYNRTHQDGLLGKLWPSIRSVQQIYHGQANAKRLSLEVIKYNMQVTQYTEAMRLTQATFRPSEPEYQRSLNLLGAMIIDVFETGTANKRLYALNAFASNPDFFRSHPNIDQLATLAFEQAVDLNMPDLALAMSELEFTHQTQGGLRVTARNTALAKMRQALQAQAYDQALEIAKPYRSDPGFRDLIIEATLLGSANSSKSLNGLVDAQDEAMFDAKLSWRDARWADAETALGQIVQSEADPPEHLQAQKSLASLLAEDDAGDLKGDAQKRQIYTIKQLNEQVTSSVSTAREYLDDG